MNVIYIHDSSKILVVFLFVCNIFFFLHLLSLQPSLLLSIYAFHYLFSFLISLFLGLLQMSMTLDILHFPEWNTETLTGSSAGGGEVMPSPVFVCEKWSGDRVKRPAALLNGVVKSKYTLEFSWWWCQFSRESLSQLSLRNIRLAAKIWKGALLNKKTCTQSIY